MRACEARVAKELLCQVLEGMDADQPNSTVFYKTTYIYTYIHTYIHT